MLPARVAALVLVLCGLGVRGELMSDECLVPLAESDTPLCSRVEDISMCYYRSKVSKTDADSLRSSLDAIDTVLNRLNQERCDINEEFNNECHDSFYDCLDSVLSSDGNGGVQVSCSDSGYEAFKACIDIRLENSFGRCYYSRWLELIVDRSRALECPGEDNPDAETANAQTTKDRGDEPDSPPKHRTKEGPSEIPAGDEEETEIPAGHGEETEPIANAAPEIDSDGTGSPAEGRVDTSPLGPSCIRGGIQYNVLDGCTKYQVEWVAQGIVYPVQVVAPGTLFDVRICGLNHAAETACPI